MHFDDIVLNAKSYGVKDDGTDSTRLLQRAIDDATLKNKPLLILGNTFSFNDINVTCSIISDSQTVIKCNKIIVSANGVTLDNLNILSRNNIAIASYGTVGRHIDSLTIKNVKVKFEESVLTDWLSMDIQRSTNLTVQNCVLDIGGINLRNCDNYLIQSNRIDGKWKNTNEPIHSSTFSRGIIDNNTILNVANTDAIDIYSSGDRCIITNNRCIGLSYAAMELKVVLKDNESDPNSSTSSGFVESTIISGNIFRDFRPMLNSSAHFGLLIAYADLRTSPVFEINKTVRGLIITNNIFEDFYKTYDDQMTPTSFVGVNVEGNNINISNNVFRNIHTHGLNVWGTCAIRLGTSVNKAVGCNINSNIISGCEGTGIDIRNAEKCIISNNIIRKDEVTGLVQKYGIRCLDGVLIDSKISNNTIESDIHGSYGFYNVDTPSAPVSIVDKVVFSQNNLIGCSIYVQTALRCIFSDNIVDNGNTSRNYDAGINIGAASLRNGTGNKIINNTFIVSNICPIVITNQKGFLISGNYTERADSSSILIVAPCSVGAISNNISYSQTGTDVVRLLNVGLPEIETIICKDNLKF